MHVLILRMLLSHISVTQNRKKGRYRVVLSFHFKRTFNQHLHAGTLSCEQVMNILELYMF